MERLNHVTSETIAGLIHELKHGSVMCVWPYRFYRGSPVVGTIEIEDGLWCEHVTMGNHCIHMFNSGSVPIDEAFVRERVDAIHALWKKDLNVFCGQFKVDACFQFHMEFPGSEDDLGIHECCVCFEPTSIMTNCLMHGRLDSHSLCASCMAKVDGKCPHKHEEFKGGVLGCMCCGESDDEELE